MNVHTRIRTLATVAAVALAVATAPAGFALAAPIDTQQFKDECEAGGGKYIEASTSVICQHVIPGKNETIKVSCDKKTGACNHFVNRTNSGDDPIMPVRSGKRQRP